MGGMAKWPERGNPHIQQDGNIEWPWHAHLNLSPGGFSFRIVE